MDDQEIIDALTERVDRLEKAVVELIVNLNRVVKVSDSQGETGPLATLRTDVMAAR